MNKLLTIVCTLLLTIPPTTYAGPSPIIWANGCAFNLITNSCIGSGSGTVSSVGLSISGGIFSVAGSPVTTTGTLTATLGLQGTNLVFAGPPSGSAATPSFRSIVAADLPAAVFELSGITAASGTNTIANANFAQIWNWDTLTTQTALKLASTSFTSGRLLNIVQTNNNAAATGQLLSVQDLSGANSPSTAINISHLGNAAGTRGLSVNMAGASHGYVGIDVSADSQGSLATPIGIKSTMTNSSNNGATIAIKGISESQNSGAIAGDFQLTGISGSAGTALKAHVDAGAGLPIDALGTGSGIKQVIRMQNTVAAANNSAARIGFSANQTAGGITDIAGVVGMITDISASYKGALIFQTADAAAPAERMRINNTGLVGIGTSTPGALLDIKSTGAANSTLRLSSLTSGTTSFRVADTVTSTAYLLPIADGTSGQVLSTDGAGVLSWATPSGGGGATTELDNLGTTAVNASINPAADNSVALGGSGNRWSNVWAVHAKGLTTIEGQTGSDLEIFSDTTLFLGGQDDIVQLYPYGGVAPSLQFTDDDASNFMAFKAPAALSGDTTFTLPDGDGTSGQVLSTDGAGVLSWEDTAASGADGSIQFATSGTLDSDNANLFWDNATKNLGIGTNTPGDAVSLSTASDKYGFVHTDGTVTFGTYVASTGPQGGYFGTKSNHSLHFFVNDGGGALAVAATGETVVGGFTAPNAQLDVKGATGLGGGPKFAISGNTSGFVGFTVPAVAGSTTYELPTADGSAGQSLTTDGAGILTWASPSTLAAHVVTTGAAPAVSACGTSPSVAGNDSVGRITVGTAPAGTCTLTFASAWGTAPACVIADETTSVLVTPTATTTTLTITGLTIAAGDNIVYHCIGY